VCEGHEPVDAVEGEHEEGHDRAADVRRDRRGMTLAAAKEEKLLTVAATSAFFRLLSA